MPKQKIKVSCRPCTLNFGKRSLHSLFIHWELLIHRAKLKMTSFDFNFNFRPRTSLRTWTKRTRKWTPLLLPMAQESSLLKLVTTCSLITEISRVVSVAFMVIIHEVTGTDDIFQACSQDSLDLGTEKEDTREFRLLVPLTYVT